VIIAMLADVPICLPIGPMGEPRTHIAHLEETYLPPMVNSMTRANFRILENASRFIA